MKYVLLYESAGDVLVKAPAHFEAHTARGQEFHERGSLLMYGPFGDPQREGSMAVSTTREAAEEFARGDPSSSSASFATRRSSRARGASSSPHRIGLDGHDPQRVPLVNDTGDHASASGSDGLRILRWHGPTRDDDVATVQAHLSALP